MAAELMHAGSPTHIAGPAVLTLMQCTTPAARKYCVDPEL